MWYTKNNLRIAQTQPSFEDVKRELHKLQPNLTGILKGGTGYLKGENENKYIIILPPGEKLPDGSTTIEDTFENLKKIIPTLKLDKTELDLPRPGREYDPPELKALREDSLTLRKAIPGADIYAAIPHEQKLYIRITNEDDSVFEGLLSEIINKVLASDKYKNRVKNPNPKQEFDPAKHYQPYNNTAAALKINNNSAQPSGKASTPSSSQPPAANLQTPSNTNFELKDGKVQLTDDEKSKLDTYLQTEAQQMGLSISKFNTRYNIFINEQVTYKNIIMNHVNNGQVNNYTPASRQMIADQILKERKDLRLVEQRMRGIISRPKSVDFKPVNDILFGQPK